MVDVALDGLGSVNSNIISPLRFGYSDDLPSNPHDPDKAKALLAECGIETPTGVMYISEAFTDHAQIVRVTSKPSGAYLHHEMLEANAYYGKLLGGECA